MSKEKTCLATRRVKILYTIIRFSVLSLLIVNIIGFFIDKDDSQRSRDIFNAIQSLLMFLCTFVPGFIEKKGKVTIPNIMSVIFILFCLAHFIIGEIGEVYIKIKSFDSILHTFSGFMIAILGFSAIRLLNNSDKTEMNLSPLFVAIFIICFTVTIGVMWEILEFCVDALTCSNMQRYRDSVSSEPLVGREVLFDTMKDLILDSIGALVISLICYIDLKKSGCTKIKWFIERKRDFKE